MFNLFKKDENYKVNLLKEREQKVTVSLAKKTDMQVKARVAFAIDVSGSMRDMFESGLVQEIIERIYPIATKFDDDKELDVWVFSRKFQYLKPVRMSNFSNYVKEIILKSANNLWEGTNYASTVKDILDNYKTSNLPGYVIFLTDGDNNDKKETELIIRESATYPLFYQFVGIGQEEFNFLEALDNLSGRIIDNTNFFKLNDIKKVSDEELYDRLLNEFPVWLKEAKSKGIIK